MFTGFNLTFFPMHIAGLDGMTRRIYTYPMGMGWEGLNLLETIGAFLLSVGILVSIWNFFVSLRSGRLAGNNPWGADSLEWDMPSPPPSYATVHIPTVVSRHPLWDDHDEEEDPFGDRVLDEGRLTLATSTLDGDPVAVARMPEDTLTPFLLGLAVSVVFTGLVLEWLWVALAALRGWRSSPASGCGPAGSKEPYEHTGPDFDTHTTAARCIRD